MTTGSTSTAEPEWSDTKVGRRRFLRGGAWGAVEFGLSTLLGLPLTIALVRVLPHRTYGTFAVAMSLCSLIGTIASLDLADGVARTLAARSATDQEPQAGDPMATGLRLAGTGAALGVLLTLGVSAALHSSRTSGSALLVLIGMPIAVTAPFLSLFIGLVRTTFRPKLAFLSTTSAAAVSLTATGVLLASGIRSAAPLMIVRSVAAAVAVGVLAARVLGRSTWRLPASREMARSILTVGAAVVVVALAAMAISELDIAVVGMFKGAAAAGDYAPLSRLIDVVLGAFAALGTYALAALTGASAGGTEVLARQYHWSTRAVLVVIGPILAVLVVTPEPVVHVLFGIHAAQAGGVVRIMAVAACGHVVLGYNGLCLIALGKARLIVVQGLSALIASAAACFSLVPAFGLYGAAEATAVALLASNVVASIYLYREFGVAPLDRAGVVAVAGFVCAVTVATGVSHLIGGGIAAAFMAFVLVFATTAATTLTASGGFSSPEIAGVRSFVARLLKPSSSAVATEDDK